MSCKDKDSLVLPTRSCPTNTVLSYQHGLVLPTRSCPTNTVLSFNTVLSYYHSIVLSTHYFPTNTVLFYQHSLVLPTHSCPQTQSCKACIEVTGLACLLIHSPWEHFLVPETGRQLGRAACWPYAPASTWYKHIKSMWYNEHIEST